MAALVISCVSSGTVMSWLCLQGAIICPGPVPLAAALAFQLKCKSWHAQYQGRARLPRQMHAISQPSVIAFAMLLPAARGMLVCTPSLMLVVHFMRSAPCSSLTLASIAGWPLLSACLCHAV